MMPTGASVASPSIPGTGGPERGFLISPFSVREIDWADRLIHLNVNRQKVKAGPPAYDETFLTYYGIRWVAG
jgi:hypothetical protein